MARKDEQEKISETIVVGDGTDKQTLPDPEEQDEFSALVGIRARINEYTAGFFEHLSETTGIERGELLEVAIENLRLMPPQQLRELLIMSMNRKIDTIVSRWNGGE